MKSIWIIVFSLSSIACLAQEVDSLRYYDSLENIYRERIMQISHRIRNSRKGILAIALDSSKRPISGVQVELDSMSDDGNKVNKDGSPWDTVLAKGVTDGSGSFLFKHSENGVQANVFISPPENVVAIEEAFEDKGCTNEVSYLLSKKEKRIDGRRMRLKSEMYASNVSHLNDSEYAHLKGYTLTDSASKMRFTLDSTLSVITAKDFKGKLLWQTNPRKDNNLMTYRIKKPIIDCFHLAINDWSNGKVAIMIGYDNSQFGFLDESSGKFTFLGQD